MEIILCIVIGLLFSLCGIAYKIGGLGKVYPIESLSFLAVAGMAFFGLRAGAEWQTASWRLLGLGALYGVTQYLGVRLLRYALNLGPLSPAWCAQSLNFVPVIVYAGFVLKENFSFFQYCSLAAAIGAIIAAACAVDPHAGKKAEGWKEKLHYGWILVSILISVSVFNVGLKYCALHTLPGQTQPILESSGNVLMALTYLFILIPVALDLTLSHSWRLNRHSYFSGGLLAVCAISGYAITLQIVGKVPAIVLFVLINAVSIFGASLLSVLFFHEKCNKAWYGTIVFSLLAVLLNR